MKIGARIDSLCSECEAMNRGSYDVKVICSNCGWEGTLRLSKGHQFSCYSKDCPSCGCSCLMRASPAVSAVRTEGGENG